MTYKEPGKRVRKQIEHMMSSEKSVLANAKKERNYDDVTQERIDESIPVIRKYASFWRMYPDLFLDMVFKPKDSTFDFFFYQRILLRAFARNRYVFATFTRAFSKSFLGILFQMLKCILYPGVKVFIVAGSKEQAASIAREKIEELFDLFPALQYEVDMKRVQFQKDYVRVPFKNGAIFDVVGALESTRGGRRHAGIMEEVVLIDGEKLHAVVLPLMNVSRTAACGGYDPNEIQKQQLYVTTAGYKDTFSYDKLIQLLIWQVIRGSSMVLGGDYRIPVAHGLLERDFINEMREDGTFNEITFEREYMSIWSGSVEDSYFSSEIIEKARTLEYAEWTAAPKQNIRRDLQPYYVIGIDVARMGGSENAQTVATAIKVIPQATGAAIKQVVNIEVWEGDHFEEQALKIKRMRDDYDAKIVAIDANGNGVGLVDYLIKPTVQELPGGSSNEKDYAQIAPPLEIINDERYDKYITDDSIPCLFNIKANAEMNHEMAVNVVSQLSSRKIELLVDERTVKSQILNRKKHKEMSSSERATFLKPYMLTSILKDEMMNLRENSASDARHSRLKRVNANIGTDKYSSLAYALYWIKTEEDKQFEREKHRGDFAEMMAFDEHESITRKRRHRDRRF